MQMKRLVSIAAIMGFMAVGVISLAAASPQQSATGVIEGTVTGPSGAETDRAAGVWVIAETRDLPTKYTKIVVTDDRGRYVIPDLPAATYDVWVRGYGLIDSRKVTSKPGATLNFRVTPAPDARAAAQYYPAGYWYSLLRVPPASDFPGTGPQGNGFSPNLQTQAHLLRQIKSGNCTACHQLGTKATRENPSEYLALGSHKAAWDRRIQSGQAGGGMSNSFNQMGRDRMLAMYADWTERIASGETPPAPPRPQGIERNVVITMWDWADPKSYLHDVVSTDRRNPRVNANGKLYGALEASSDYLPVLDPMTHVASRVPLTVRDTNTPRTSAHMPAPSPYWGNEPIWTSRNNVHNPMLDERGRVWITSAVEPPETPAFCRAGSSHPSAQVFPMNRSFRHLQVYDPKTEKLTHIRTCYSTHHLMFAEDANNTLWTSGGGPVIGWLNVKQFDATGDEQASQGWTPLVLDFNGNGRRDEWTDPNAPADSTKDRRLGAGFYAVAPAPDGSIWGSGLGMPGGIIRLVPGSDPSRTALVEWYEPPFNNPAAAVQGFSPRGMDIDRNGIAWVALASGHLASFDRRKCKNPLNGPSATGQHCPEGWTLYKEPLPQFQGVSDGGSVEASYYTWVDQFDVLGLGANTPINTGNAAEGLLALDDGRWVVLRVPYPLGFYTKWLDGRVDDPSGGWKGRGLWAAVSTRAPFHMEGGKGTTSKVLKFQLRPNPLAR